MRIPIALICDRNFLMQTTVTITSILENKAPDTEIVFYVVTAGPEDETWPELQQYSNLTVIHAGTEIGKDIRQHAHITTACLLKFYLAELIPQEDKLLYLDGDIIVRGDLAELYQTEIGENYALGTPAVFENGKINAGVMLFDCTKMRRDNMAEKLMEYRRGLGDIKSMDQSTFNAMIPHKIGRFSWKYNCIPVIIRQEADKKSLNRLNMQNKTQYQSLDRMLQDAVVVHFASATKPWKHAFVEFGDEWYQYYLRSPFGNIPLHRQSKLEYWMNKAKEIGPFTMLKNKLRSLRQPSAIDEWG